MKRTFYLILTFLIWNAVNMYAQITIGSSQDPQDGAILDLSKVNDRNLGLLLPRVSLANTADWQLKGSSSDGIGMLIYNTNPNTTGGNGNPGVYIWTGEGWEALKPNLSNAVQVEDFDLTPSSGTVDIYTGGTVSFTTSNFIPGNASYPGVTWAISNGGDKASINNENKSMTSCTVVGLAVGTATLTITSLDENIRKTVIINVKACTMAPAAPTGITFSKTTGIKLEEEITAVATPEVTSGSAMPTKYNWTIPGSYFDIISGAGTRKITIKAKATASSITNAIKVNAENVCGTSADYDNTTAISILNCSVAPATPAAISLSATSMNVNSTFTASVPEVTGINAPTSYTWTLPKGLTGSSSTNSITITCVATGNYAAGQIQVTASNACGTSATQSSTSDVTVIPPVCSSFIISNGAYSGPTNLIPKDGDPIKMNQLTSIYGFAVSGDLCLATKDQGKYSWEDAKAACEALNTGGDSGWRLPNIAELGNLQQKQKQYNLQQFSHWSSTELSSTEAFYWLYLYEYSYKSPKKDNLWTRCVKSL